MVNYEDGKIYKIVCDSTQDTYYGSTTMPLYKRKSVHKDRAKVEGHYTSSKIINGGNWRMVLIETYPCKTKEELFAREQYYIENFQCVNKNIPKHTVESKKAKQAECHKKWREENREYNLQKKKEYHHANKEAIAEKKKVYRENNKEAIAEKKKEAYITDKENGKCEPTTCECGGSYSFRNRSRHLKTKRHQDFLNQ